MMNRASSNSSLHGGAAQQLSRAPSASSLQPSQQVGQQGALPRENSDRGLQAGATSLSGQAQLKHVGSNSSLHGGVTPSQMKQPTPTNSIGGGQRFQLKPGSLGQPKHTASSTSLAGSAAAAQLKHTASASSLHGSSAAPERKNTASHSSLSSVHTASAPSLHLADPATVVAASSAVASANADAPMTED